MNYTENFDGIKLDVQAVDITISDALQQSIREMITRLRRHVSKVYWVDVYLNEKSGKSTDPTENGYLASNMALYKRMVVRKEDAYRPRKDAAVLQSANAPNGRTAAGAGTRDWRNGVSISLSLLSTTIVHQHGQCGYIIKQWRRKISRTI